MEGWNFWWGIAAFFLGGLATQLNGWLAYRRQRKDRADDAADALRQRREEFELQHLVEVNQLLRNLLDGLLHMSAAMAIMDRLGNDDDQELPEEFKAAAASANAAEGALTAAAGFILDDGIRAQVQAALEAADEASATVLTSDTPGEGLYAAAAVMTPAFKSISARVRELYAGR